MMIMTDSQRQSLAHCRRIFLKNYDVSMSIGAYEEEKLAPQRVRVNIDLYVPLSASSSHQDDIVDVLDYNLMRDTVQACAQEHIHLQETLCDAVAAKLLAHEAVKAVRVSTEKPEAYADCESVGVEVFHVKAHVDIA